MRCRQDYSTARGSSDESTTLSKLSSNTKRHLIYHIWPKSGTGSWRWNVQQLLNRIDLFTGTRSIGISVGSDADDVDAVKSAFAGTRIDHWIVRDNDPSRGEGTTFRAMLSTLPIDGITFYAHAKGVRYNPMAPAIRKWVELMYRVNIDDWPTASRALDDFPIVGAFKQHFHVVKRRDCHNWHFAGTFFWMRNEEVFRRPEWRELVGGYYAVELWPGRLFHSTEAFCLFGEDLLDPYSEIEMNRWEALFSGEQSRS